MLSVSVQSEVDLLVKAFDQNGVPMEIIQQTSKSDYHTSTAGPHPAVIYQLQNVIMSKYTAYTANVCNCGRIFEYFSSLKFLTSGGTITHQGLDARPTCHDAAPE